MCAACASPSTLLQLDADPSVIDGRDGSDRLDGYCVALGADGRRRFGRRYSMAEHPLPQSLGVRSDGRPTAAVRVDGLSAGVRAAMASTTFDFSSQTVSLALTACTPRAATSALALRATLPMQADRLAVMRTGAEEAGAAELVALGGTGGARYRFQKGTPVALDGPALSRGLGSPVAALASLDVDGDCGDDLVVMPGDHAPQVWSSASDGDIAADPSRIPAVPAAAALAIADVNGDGKADLVTAGDEGLAVLLGNGGGFDEKAGAIDVQPSGARAVVAGDLDGDGRVDLVVGQEIGPLRWLRGDGAGRFLLQSPALPGFFEVEQLILHDMDGDGDLDVVAAVRGASSGGGLHVFRNDKGVFTDVASAVPSGLGATVLALVEADLDGDCVDELVAIGSSSAPRWLGWSTGAPGGLVDRGPIGALPALAGVAGDLDGDGVAELALVMSAEITIYAAVSP